MFQRYVLRLGLLLLGPASWAGIQVSAPALPVLANASLNHLAGATTEPSVGFTDFALALSRAQHDLSDVYLRYGGQIFLKEWDHKDLGRLLRIQRLMPRLEFYLTTGTKSVNFWNPLETHLLGDNLSEVGLYPDSFSRGPSAGAAFFQAVISAPFQFQMIPLGPKEHQFESLNIQSFFGGTYHLKFLHNHRDFSAIEIPMLDPDLRLILLQAKPNASPKAVESIHSVAGLIKVAQSMDQLVPRKVNIIVPELASLIHERLERSDGREVTLSVPFKLNHEGVLVNQRPHRPEPRQPSLGHSVDFHLVGPFYLALRSIAGGVIYLHGSVE